MSAKSAKVVWSRNGDLADEPLHYKGCGLDDVWLMSYERGVSDGEEYITIPDLEGLHRAIARYLVERKKILTGKEIRFLRIQMDLTQSELARLFGCDAQQIARYEKGENKMPGPADRLLRALYKGHLDDEVPIKELLRAIDEMDGRMNDKQMFRNTKTGWRAAA